MVRSPDNSKSVAVTFVRGKGDGDATSIATLYSGQKQLVLPLNHDWAQMEILWSPDSQSVALTGTFNAYTESTRIFGLENGELKAAPLNALRKDMAKTYPLCEGANADESCHAEENGRHFNYATIAWADVVTAVIMAEIPCSSGWGGMMCQVKGYEIDVRSGRILRRMPARDLKKRWQSKLAWKLRIPNGPYLKSKT